jgi:CHAD domain-containing protein
MPQPVTVFLRQGLMLKAAIAACLKKASPARVHHLRSTTRRIEATLELLVLSADISRDGISRIDKQSKPLQRSLRKLRRAAGNVRDADVQSDLLSAYNRTPDAKRLREDLTAVRKKAERKLIKRLKQEQKRIELRLHNLEASLSPALDLNLSGAKLITVTQTWFAENIRGLDPHHDQDLHTLRKASKTARYLAETGVDASKAVATLATRYEAAQKSLGEWHDHFLLLHEAHSRLPQDSETIEQIQQDMERLHQRADAAASHLLATA